MSIRPITRIAAGVFLLGFVFAACAQAPETPLVANATDSMFMTHAAADGMAEIQMGKMALEKSSDAKVKQLAQRIVDDHTDANAKLWALAETKQISLPAASTDESQQAAGAMMALDATEFDQAWAAGMVKDHQKAVALFTREIKQTQDPEVHAFAEETLPTLKTHLELAQQLQDQLGLPAARDQAMSHGVSADDSFARTNPAAAATTGAVAIPDASAPAGTGGSQ